MEIEKQKEILLAHLQKATVHGDKYILSLSPFRNESNPSFVYYFDHQYYKDLADPSIHGHLNDLLKQLNLEEYIEQEEKPSHRESEESKTKTFETFEPAKVDYDELNDLTEKYFANLHGITSKEWVLNGYKPIKQNENHKYWLKRGISIDTIAKMGVGCGEDSRGFFYSLPYFWVFGEDMKQIEIVAIKKIYPHQAREGKKDSYGIYPQVPTLLYHQPAILYARKHKIPLTVFEGEKDLLMALEHGYRRVSIAIPGKSTFKPSFVPLFWGIQKVILFLDNDADDAMNQIIQMFDEYRNYMSLPIVEKFDWNKFNLPKGGDFTDLVHQNKLGKGRKILV